MQPPDALARQLRLHLESLRAAGVEFVPVVAPMRFEVVAAAEESETAHAAEPVASTTSPAPDTRRHALAMLAEQVAPCDRCTELFATRTQTVFGVGPIDPEICFVGEAPGADEDAQGEPFVGRAGQLLNKIIAAMGFRREDVYICNTLKCRPPNNRTPTPDERANCREYFDSQLALVKPKYIVCLGATAAKNVLNSTLGIGKLRGKIHRYQSIPVVCTYHPSAILREEPAQVLRKACWDDMKLLLREMGRPIPRK